MKRIGAVTAGVLLLAGSTFRADAMSFPGRSNVLQLRGIYQLRLKDDPGAQQSAKKSIQYDNYRTQRGEEK